MNNDSKKTIIIAANHGIAHEHLTDAIAAIMQNIENDEPLTQELVRLSNQAATIAARRRQARDEATLTN